MLNITKIRHPKESFYFHFMVILSVLFYIPLIIGLVFIFPLVLVLLLIGWWSSLRFKAQLYGNSICVSTEQYSEIYSIAQKHAEELGIMLPPLFIQNSEGAVNAFAQKKFLSSYVILNSSLVDLLLSTGRKTELASIIAHELGHHAAGHLKNRKKFLIYPAYFVPILGQLLGFAYSRACELTCDRISYGLTKDIEAAQRGLFALGLGSKSLLPEGKLDSFIMQEYDIPQFAAFINKLFTSHPRLTVRLIELRSYVKTEEKMAAYQNIPIQQISNRTPPIPSIPRVSTAFQQKRCTSCGNSNASSDKFCINCGNKLA